MTWKLRALRKMMLLCLAGGALNVGLCASSENFNEFRQSAGPGLESGVQALLDGDETAFATMLTSIVGGLFDIFEPDSSSGN